MQGKVFGHSNEPAKLRMVSHTFIVRVLHIAVIVIPMLLQDFPSQRSELRLVERVSHPLIIMNSVVVAINAQK